MNPYIQNNSWHTDLKTETMTFKIAVVGAGPSAMYLTMRLLKKSSNTNVYIFDRSYTPFGLIRTGVSPDTIAIKNLSETFSDVLNDDRVFFFGNSNVDQSTLEKMQNHFHGIVMCTGMCQPRRLTFKGADLIHNASDIFKTYNSLKEQKFPFERTSTMAIIGQGNVALDISRILLSNPEKLYSTEISQTFLKQLYESKVNRIILIGRKGPLDVSFSPAELRETIHAAHNCDFISDPCLFDAEDSDSLNRRNRRVLQLMKDSFRTPNHVDPSKDKQLALRFYLNPYEIEKMEHSGYKLFCKRADRTSETIIADMIVSCIGFEGETSFALDYGPNNTFVNSDGVINPKTGLYTAGWAKTGAIGSLSASFNDATSIADKIISDRAKLETRKIVDFNFTKIFTGITYTDKDTWKQINDFEKIMGQKTGKLRVKTCPDFISLSC